jgi:cob(I)alamin adenosyltransferase
VNLELCVEPDAHVEVLDLKDVYDKVQKKTVEGSEQRIANGVINMAVSATAQVSAVRVFVRRCEKAAAKTSDKIGINSYANELITSKFIAEMNRPFACGAWALKACMAGHFPYFNT